MIECGSDLHFSFDIPNQADIMSEVFVYVLRKEIALAYKNVLAGWW
jgi:hypothetical protein